MAEHNNVWQVGVWRKGKVHWPRSETFLSCSLLSGEVGATVAPPLRLGGQLNEVAVKCVASACVEYVLSTRQSLLRCRPEHGRGQPGDSCGVRNRALPPRWQRGSCRSSGAQWCFRTPSPRGTFPRGMFTHKPWFFFIKLFLKIQCLSVFEIIFIIQIMSAPFRNLGKHQQKGRNDA